MEISQEITGNPEEGLVVSMSTPSAGLIAVQMQAKQPAQLKARVYGRYPVRELLLNIHTTWNMEMPYDVMLGLKEHVPAAVELVSEPAARTYNEIYKKAEKARKQGQVMFERAANSFAAVNPSEVMTSATEKIVETLKLYQKKVEIVLDAMMKFLRETKFQVPGYEQRLSGLEVYQKCSAFVAQVSEEAVQKIPEYFASMFTSVIDYLQDIEFTIPGSSYIINGREILEDLSVALRKIQQQVIATLRELGKIQLEDIINKFYAFVQFTTEQSEKLVQTLKSQNIKKISDFVIEMYRDAINSPVLANVAKQIGETYRIVMEYLKTVRAKIQNTLAEMSTEQLQADIQSWIDSLVKRMNAFHNNVIRTLKEKSKNVEQFVKVSDRTMEVDIPLPFVARSN
uniref:Uncharacterized protein n=1 Tax=Echeneis naucrates TaxID=173247 RepID=A0A665W7T9_ECHNA